MYLDGMQINNWAIKSFQTKQYAEAFLAGELYMKESGFFRKLDDSFRGDKYDSKGIFDSKLKFEFNNGVNKLMFIDGKATNGDIYIDDITFGFSEDNKIPILCQAILDSGNLVCISNGKYTLNKQFTVEMNKFGKYFVLFSIDELIYKLTNFVRDRKLNIKYGKIVYKQIAKRNPFEDYNSDIYEPFFIKDSSYRNQNEFRIIIDNNNHTLVSAISDYYIANIDKLEYACILGTLDDLIISVV